MDVLKLGLHGEGRLVSAADGTEQESDLERRHHGLPALVLVAPGQAASVTSRLYRVTGEHAVAHRGAGVEGHPGQARSNRVADLLEMRGAAADDRAQAGHGVMVEGKFGGHDG